MPVMDQSSMSDFFTTIDSKAYNYSTGYQIFVVFKEVTNDFKWSHWSKT